MSVCVMCLCLCAWQSVADINVNASQIKLDLDKPHTLSRVSETDDSDDCCATLFHNTVNKFVVF